MQRGNRRPESLLSQGFTVEVEDRQSCLSGQAGLPVLHVRSRPEEAHGATIEDLGSRNGAVVNGEAISDMRALADDSEILIGDVALLFRTSAQSDTAETAGS